MRILVFGDSIAYGFYDTEKGGWVERLKAYLYENTDDDGVYNLGISADKTVEILKRLELEAKVRNPGLIIFAIDINDSVLLKKENENWVNIDKFKENIKDMIRTSKTFTDKIIFIGITMVDESKVTPIPWDTNKYYTNENIAKYNTIIKNICKDSDLLFLDLFDEFNKIDYKKLLHDGLHPNSEGHKLIFEKVKDFLIANHII
ncbi:MAG: hypothetical protein KJ697_03595 [Nanoarchaeota archaeon]|nr:hypothetical protein [Nanoarchaeota archaeon]